MLLLALAACFLRPSVEVDPRDVALDAADARFLARSEDSLEEHPALDAAIAGWSALLAEDAADTAVLSRLAHASWILAQVDAAGRRTHLEVGEDFGWRCLLTSPALAASGQVDRARPDALEALDAGFAPCLAWTAMNALDRARLRGPGAALAVEEAGALVRRLRVLQAEPTPWAPVPGLVDALEGQVAWALAKDDAARGVARGRIADAVAAAPGFLRWRMDLARTMRAPGAAPPAQDGPFALENLAVRRDWPGADSAGDEP